MKRIKMFVFDVDGTIYDEVNHEVPISTIAAIHKLKEKGFLFVIATGRAHYALGKKIQALNPDYIISVNGGVVVDHHNQIISHLDFSRKEVDEIISFAHQSDAGLVFKFIDRMYIYQHAEKIDSYQEPKRSEIGSHAFIEWYSQDHHLHTLPQGASIRVNAKDVANTFKDHQRLNFIPYANDGFDICLKNVNKSVGLIHLMDYLHIQKEEVCCVGDNYNDLEMMKVAGYKIAMGNAVDEVKNIADYITTASNEDGIYLALKELKFI